VAQRFKQALEHGDSAAMEVLASELRDDGSQAVIADRLEGMAHLARGQLSEALRRLEHAKESAAVLSAGDRSRAALALGVALATAGRGTEALLEGLEALARAREAGDTRGEIACARFLSQLSLAAGSPDAAERWAEVAGR
jgi:PleD family two-component response regulator